MGEGTPIVSRKAQLARRADIESRNMGRKSQKKWEISAVNLLPRMHEALPALPGHQVH